MSSQAWIERQRRECSVKVRIVWDWGWFDRWGVEDSRAGTETRHVKIGPLIVSRERWLRSEFLPIVVDKKNRRERSEM